MRRFITIVHAINATLGKGVSLLIFIMVGAIMYETVARYFFDSPTAWAHDVSGWMQVCYVFIGGAYALQKGYMVRVDILFTALPPRVQAAIDLTVGTLLFGCFAAVMFSKGFTLALQSFNMGETSSTGVWAGPVYPSKFMVPAGMVLLILAWLAHMAQQLLRIIDPEAQPIEAQEVRIG